MVRRTALRFGEHGEMDLRRGSHDQQLPGALPPWATTLPLAHGSADLAGPRLAPGWIALCLSLTFFSYVIWIPQFLRFSNPPTGDQASYLMVVASLAQDHDLNIKNNYADRDFDKFYSLAPHPAGYVGISAPYPPPPDLATSTRRPPTEWYNNHLPGLPLLLVPAWIIGSWFALWWPATIVLMCVIGALVVLNILLLAHDLTGRPQLALAVSLPLALSNPIMTYSYVIFSELLTGLLILYAFRRLALGWDRNSPPRLLLVGFCIAYIPWVAPRAILVSVILAVYALHQWKRARKTQSADSTTDPGTHRPLQIASRSIPVAAFPGLFTISMGLLIWYHAFLYARVADIFAKTAPAFHWPWAGKDEMILFVRNGLGLLYDQDSGILLFSPIYTLAGVGMIVMFGSRRRSDRRLLFWLLLVSLPYALMIAAYEDWHGIWCPPARYLTSLAPLAAAPLAMSIAAASRGWRRWAYRAIYALLAGAGIAMMAVFLQDARRMWPERPGNALHLTIRVSGIPRPIDLRPVTPSFRWPDEIRIPWQSGGLLLTSLLLMILSLYMNLGNWKIELSGTATPSSGIRTALPWVAGCALVASAWLVANHEYLRHKTLLIERCRWQLPFVLHEPRGMAYLDARIYIPSFGERFPSGETAFGELGSFDLQTCVYSTIQPRSAFGLLSWSHPGDVKVGRGNLLYVLNNGPAEDALWIMQPDGLVLDSVPLPANTPVTKGLHIDLTQDIYVSDMLRGTVTKYSRARNREWHATQVLGGLNNPAGVAVDGREMIYAADGYRGIRQTDVAGHLLRRFPMRCAPQYFTTPAADSGWLDTNCLDGFFSLDTRQNRLQLSRVAEAGGGFGHVTAITYGRPNKLYALDGSILVEYDVRH